MAQTTPTQLPPVANRDSRTSVLICVAILLAILGCGDAVSLAGLLIERCPVIRMEPVTLPERIWLPTAMRDSLSISIYHSNQPLSPADCGMALSSTDVQVIATSVIASGPGHVEFHVLGNRAGSALLQLSTGPVHRASIDAAVTDSETLLSSIGHRGAGNHAPENTMAAMRLAARYPVPGVEFDVRLTKDSIPILMHDDSFKRTTGFRAKVAETPYAISQALNAARYNPAFPAEPPPSLSAVLHFLGTTDIPLVLAEIKHEDNFSPEVEAKRVLRAARGSGLDKRLVFYSGSTEVLRALRSQDTTISLGLMAPEWLNTQRSFLAKYNVRYIIYPFSVFSSANAPALSELRAADVQLIGYTAERLSDADSFVLAHPGALVIADSVPALFGRSIAP